MEYVLAEIGCHLLGLLEATMDLLGLIKGVIASECLPFSFGILLEKKR